MFCGFFSLKKLLGYPHILLGKNKTKQHSDILACPPLEGEYENVVLE